jgi:capsular exopolysaccharide synthesis family protein
MRTDPPTPPESSPAEYDSAAADDLRLSDYVRILFRRRWMIAAIVVGGLLAGLAYTRLTTAIFESQATVQIDVDPNVLGVERPLLPVDQRDWMREFVPTELAILQSRELARTAQEELKRAEPVRNEVARASTTVPTVDEIIEGRTVSVIRDTRLVSIGFRSADPALAADVANAITRAYLRRNVDFRVQTSVEAADWLARQVEEQRSLVEQSEAGLQRYRQQHGADALMSDDGGIEQQNIVVQKLAALQAAETKARIDTIEREAEYRQLQHVQANQEPLDTVPVIASNLHIQALKADLAALQRQLAQASKELRERHPEILKLQGAVQAADGKLQTELSNAARAIQNNFEAARTRERELVEALRRQEAEVQALNGKAVEYTALEREAAANRDVLDSLLQRSREAALARQLETTNVRIVDWAEVPVFPAFPRQERVMTIALVGSGSLALMLGFIFEIFTTRIRFPDDVKQHLRIPLIGVVPAVKTRGGRVSLLLGKGAPPQFAELFRVVRTNLLWAPGLATGRVLLVTSSEPEEGKTVCAANVAVSLARLNQRVVLIDADLRSPRLHELFQQEQQPGLADVLMGRTTSHDLRDTYVPGLWLMPAGSASGNPSDLLGSVTFTELISDLRSRFDWVVLDSPPVLAVTDPCLIARAASGVLLVVDCGRTTRTVAAAAVERLDSVRAALVGAMLNRVVLDRKGASYLPYYHREYKAYYPRETEMPRPELPPADSAPRQQEPPHR